jgi:hypothetical protein
MKTAAIVLAFVFALVTPSVALGSDQRVDVICDKAAKESCDMKTEVVSKNSSVSELAVYTQCRHRFRPMELKCSSPNVFVACPGASTSAGQWLVCKCGPSGASASRTLPNKYKVRTQIQC